MQFNPIDAKKAGGAMIKLASESLINTIDQFWILQVNDNEVLPINFKKRAATASDDGIGVVASTAIAYCFLEVGSQLVRREFKAKVSAWRDSLNQPVFLREMDPAFMLGEVGNEQISLELRFRFSGLVGGVDTEDEVSISLNGNITEFGSGVVSVLDLFNQQYRQNLSTLFWPKLGEPVGQYLSHIEFTLEDSGRTYSDDIGFNIKIDQSTLSEIRYFDLEFSSIGQSEFEFFLIAVSHSGARIRIADDSASPELRYVVNLEEKVAESILNTAGFEYETRR